MSPSEHPAGGRRLVRSFLATSLSWLCLAALVFLGVRVVDFQPVGVVLLQASPMLLGLALGLRVGVLLVDAFVQQAVLASLGWVIPYRDLVFLELGAMPFKLGLAGKVGELVKPGWLRHRHAVPLVEGVGALAVYKLLSLAGTGLVVALGLALAAPGGPVPTGPAVGTGLAVLALGAAMLPGRLPDGLPLPDRLARPWRRLASATRQLRGVALLRLLALVLAVQLGQLLVALLCFRAAAVHVGLGDFMVFYGVAGLAAVMPITPGGLGTRDGAAVLLMAHLAPPSEVLAASLLATTALVVLPAVVGLPLVPTLLRGLGWRARPEPGPAGDELKNERRGGQRR